MEFGKYVDEEGITYDYSSWGSVTFNGHKAVLTFVEKDVFHFINPDGERERSSGRLTKIVEEEAEPSP
ncbi:MAG: hypothetical protein NUV97_00885 [archaeon]|nr:hypothetical protein [archaeon]MCR4323484.1 hypothetical protein [Nanoarchaeota archaeon]